MPNKLRKLLARCFLGWTPVLIEDILLLIYVNPRFLRVQVGPIFVPLVMQVVDQFTFEVPLALAALRDRVVFDHGCNSWFRGSMICR